MTMQRVALSSTHDSRPLSNVGHPAWIGPDVPIRDRQYACNVDPLGSRRTIAHTTQDIGRTTEVLTCAGAAVLEEGASLFATTDAIGHIA